MRADINTIARECGVSKATVSRVFTGKASVSKAVKNKILAVARELNYTPQQVAAREVIAIVVKSLEDTKQADGFRTILLINLVAEITQSGYLVNIVEAKDMNKLLGSYTKAAVLLFNEMDAVNYTDQIKQMDIPLIAIGNKIDGCHCIYTNYEEELSTAVNKLVENGHERISILLDNPETQASQERYEGYIKTLTKSNLAPLPLHRFKFGQQSLIELLATILQDEPTALVVCGESITNEVAYALNLLRVKVPLDLSLISFEKRDSSRWFSPPHTTIDQDIDNTVHESIKLIKEVIKTPTKNAIIKLLPCKIIERNSIKNIKQ